MNSSLHHFELETTVARSLNCLSGSRVEAGNLGVAECVEGARELEPGEVR